MIRVDESESARGTAKMKEIKRYLSKPEHPVLVLAGVAGLVTIALLILAVVTGDRAYGRYARWALLFALMVALLPFAAFLVDMILEMLAKIVKKILLVVVSIGVLGLAPDVFSDNRLHHGWLRISDGGKEIREPQKRDAAAGLIQGAPSSLQYKVVWIMRRARTFTPSSKRP